MRSIELLVLEKYLFPKSHFYCDKNFDSSMQLVSVTIMNAKLIAAGQSHDEKWLYLWHLVYIGFIWYGKQFLSLNASKAKKKLTCLSYKEQSMIKLFLDLY